MTDNPAKQAPNVPQPRTRITILSVWVATALPLAACSGGSSVLETPRWPLPAAPSLTIGVDEGPPELMFAQIHDVVSLSDGGIAVADGGANEIRLFDERGRHKRTLGGAGQGPGEFQGLWLVRELDDGSIAALDYRSQRVTKFLPDDSVWTAPTPPVPDGFRNGFMEEIFSDGALLLTASRTDAARPRPGAGVVDHDQSYFVYPPDSGDPVLIGDFFLLRWLDGRELSLFTPNGRWTVANNLFFHGPAYEYAIYAFDRGGSPVREYRNDSWEPIVVTEAAFGSWRDSKLQEAEAARGPDGREHARKQLNEAPRAETMPAYDRFVVDTENRVWVREIAEVTSRFPGYGVTVVNESPTTWTVLGQQGICAAVTLPPGFVLYRIDATRLMGTQTDEWGTERVALYEMELGESRCPDHD